MWKSFKTLWNAVCSSNKGPKCEKSQIIWEMVNFEYPNLLFALSSSWGKVITLSILLYLLAIFFSNTYMLWYISIYYIQYWSILYSLYITNFINTYVDISTRSDRSRRLVKHLCRNMDVILQGKKCILNYNFYYINLHFAKL